MRKASVLFALGVLVAVALFSFTGCSRTPPAEEPIIEPEVAEETSALTGEDLPLSEQPEGIVYVSPESTEFENIYFDFDRYSIRGGDEITLQRVADWLRNHEDVRLLIEGHCDERGTNEYNMALGEQRALAARRYIVGLGVGSDRITTISYGEERPVDPRATEDAWAMNRRAEFAVSQ